MSLSMSLPLVCCPHCTKQFNSKRLLALHRSQYQDCTTVFGRRVAARTRNTDHPAQPDSDLHRDDNEADYQINNPQSDASIEAYSSSIQAAVASDDRNSTPEHWSIHELAKLLANWANGKGCAAADQQQLLNLLHDSRFRIDQVTQFLVTDTRTSDIACSRSTRRQDTQYEWQHTRDAYTVPLIYYITWQQQCTDYRRTVAMQHLYYSTWQPDYTGVLAKYLANQPA